MVVFETRLLPNSVVSRSLPEPIMMIIIDGVGDGDDNDDHDDDDELMMIMIMMTRELSER